MNGLVWIDMETTGLKESAHILEIACVITDTDGVVKESVSEVVLPMQSKTMTKYIGVMEASPPGSPDRYVYEMHQKSNLWQDVLDIGQHLNYAEGTITSFLGNNSLEYNLEYGVMPMCGNSVWSDHAWIRYSMPQLSKMFSHRNIDVSSTKEVVKYRHPEIAAEWKERTSGDDKPHRAMEDILYSTFEYRFYIEKGMIA